MSKGLKFLAVCVYILIALGSWVRNLGAGLACPDWPLCFGKLIPHFDIQIFAEFFHRLIAGLVSLVFLFFVIKITTNKSWRALLGRLTTIAVILLMSQILLGGLTVLKLLKSEIVTLHLATGTLFFAIITLMALRAHRFKQPPVMFTIAKDHKRDVPTETWRWGILSLTILYIQILLGGMVASHYAGLACPDFPLCLGEIWPTFEGTVGLHLMHRLGALITTVIISVFTFHILRKKALPKHISWIAIALFTTLLTQVLLGIGNVLMRLPVWMSVAHLAVAELLFALVLMATYEVRHHQLHQSH